MRLRYEFGLTNSFNMPRETPKPTLRYNGRAGTLVCKGNCIWFKRHRHTLASIILSIWALLVATPMAIEMNTWCLMFLLGDETGWHLADLLTPWWIVYMCIRVPDVFLHDPIDTRA